MKTTKIKLGLLTAALAPFLMGCPKTKTAVAPEPDKEFQSSIDASKANLMVMDIDMLCSFMGEADLQPDFYIHAPGEDPVRPIVIRGQNPDKIIAGYNTTRCVDGVVRDGSINMYYTNANPNARYYRNFEYRGNVEFESYRVDGWQVKIPAGKTFQVYNTLSSSVYNPSQTKLTWSIEGSLEFIHPTDASKNMTWNGKLNKTLVNSTNSAVFNTSGQQMINWADGVVEYTGEVSGVTPGNVPYKLVIDKVHPLTRDFTCSADVIGGVETVVPLKTWSKEFHPVKSGIVTLTTGDKYPRQIYYGNENNPQSKPQCDNSGEVLIKGISYPIDFQ